MPRRGDHEGNVSHRTDGRWAARISIAGKAYSRYAKTEEEAWQKLALLRAALKPAGAETPSAPTLREWCERWLHLRGAQLRHNSIRAYRDMLTMVCDAGLGATRLADLKALALADAFAVLAKSRGPRVVAHAWVTLRRVLDDAVTYEELAANPMRKLPRGSRPMWEPRDRVYWRSEEAVAFIDWALAQDPREHPYYPMFVLLVTCGLRLGEALALDWKDVDIAAGTLRVVATLVQVDSRTFLLNPPKTRRGRRVVHLPAKAVQALGLREPKPEGPVFRGLTGKPPLRGTLATSLHRACARAGVPEINVHGLRHVAAHLALQAGRDAHAVRRRLGHEKVTMTLDHYDYAEIGDEAVADGLDGILGG